MSAHLAVNDPSGWPTPPEESTELWAPDGELAVIAALPALALAATLVLALLVLATAIRAATWPTAPGRIEYSNIASIPYTDWHGRHHVTTVGDVTYRYTVGGTEYYNRTVDAEELSPVLAFPTPAEAADEYTEGQAVRVHYDPAHPATAVLDVLLTRQTTGVMLLILFFGGLLTGLLGWGCLRAFKCADGPSRAQRFLRATRDAALALSGCTVVASALWFCIFYTTIVLTVVGLGVLFIVAFALFCRLLVLAGTA